MSMPRSWLDATTDMPQIGACYALILLGACVCAASCGTDASSEGAPGAGGTAAPASGGSSNSLGGGSGGTSNATGGSSGGAPGAGETGGATCSDPVSGARVHPGNYENRGCNTEGCHVGFSGGWLYPNLAGGEWISDATITVQNPDGSVVTAYSATDGFFALIGSTSEVGRIQVPYVPCVSRCPNGTVCGSAASHTDIDCQASTCHGAANLRIYLPVEAPNTGGTTGTGGSSGDPDCVPATPGGPSTHAANVFDTQACQVCHDDLYTGGFLYDGATTDATVVTQATVKLTQADGSTQVALSGQTGMFYFPGLVTPPYTPCVSKCPDTTCAAETHTATEDCRECHHDETRIHLP